MISLQQATVDVKRFISDCLFECVNELQELKKNGKLPSNARYIPEARNMLSECYPGDVVNQLVEYYIHDGACQYVLDDFQWNPR